MLKEPTDEPPDGGRFFSVESAAGHASGLLPKPENPSLDDLADLTLGEDLQKIFDTALALCGGELGVEERTPALGSASQCVKCSVARLPSAKSFVLLFPRWLLSDPKQWP